MRNEDLKNWTVLYRGGHKDLWFTWKDDCLSKKEADELSAELTIRGMTTKVVPGRIVVG